MIPPSCTPENKWRFWIDVGGTFTDCVGRSPQGELHTCKVLSSANVAGRACPGSQGAVLIDDVLKGTVVDFYRGYSLMILNSAGKPQGEAQVVASNGEAGSLSLSPGLPRLQAGRAYRLASPEEAPLLAIRTLMGLRLDEPIGPVHVRLGTTAGTNALLEHKGAAVALVTTDGFPDVLEIGTQTRPQLFELQILKPAMLQRRVIEIKERVGARGEVLVPADRESIRKVLSGVLDEGIRSLAIALLNSVWNPVHENMVADVAAELGFEHISVSHRLSPTIKLLNRGDTAVVDAYLSPVLKRYIRSLKAAISEAGLKLMTSAGGLVSADAFTGKDSILSGPAGGVVGCVHVAKEAGFEQVIGFDMGGTSTDVSRYTGEFQHQFVAEKGGVRIVAPMLAIETVAAGGGSICSYNEQRLLVGPESAGASPGPACYGRGGPLTITDVNFYNGKIDEASFPFPLAKDAVIHQLEQIRRKIRAAEHRNLSLEEIADGFTRLANQKMAAAIKQISSAQGYDPAHYLLVSFGGAGAQHACAIAEQLGIRSILLHQLGGILSAYGIGVADVRRFAEKTVLRPYGDGGLDELEQWFISSETRLRGQVLAEGIERDRIPPALRFLDLRYRGEEATITIACPPGGDYREPFESRHEQLYGYRHQQSDIEIAIARIEVVGITRKPVLPYLPEAAHPPQPERMIRVRYSTGDRNTPLYRRSCLGAGTTLEGPAMIVEPYSTILIDPGWRLEVKEDGNLLLHRDAPEQRNRHHNVARDPIRLELFNHHFTHIATQMGITLQRTALSVNVKERLDYSCAILDHDGNLVVNAPHIPVHLGAMGEAVKGLLESEAQLTPGDVFLTNDPRLGGSHLPDLTVITPVFDENGQDLRFFAASRAHHAEIGGIRPGSAFPFARSLAEEGIVIRNLKIVSGGEWRGQLLREKLLEGPWPSRSPDENVADIRAAIAANQTGIRDLRRLIGEHTWPVVSAYMAHIRDAATEKTIAALARFDRPHYRFSDQMDNGAAISVRISPGNDAWTVDFTGSAPTQEGSLNANRAVVQSALIYCLRCLIAEDIPLNAGVMAPVKLILPPGMLNPPDEADSHRYPGVFAGNVEISQRLVDVIFGALEICAASQGTMNNFIFGNDRFGYYETICGGSGAGPGYHGASALHSHMTNTRMTDIEIIEHRYPVRLHRFQIRRGSGGNGRWRGGDGIIREVEFLEPLEVSLLTQRRGRGPYGMNGGSPGSPGRNRLLRKGARTHEELESLVQIDVHAGDRLIIETPGGGGFGGDD